ncbi:MAG: four helix bundle protein [Paludibacteraceae bacterium]|nr:four helix bundle protein [Paludibacteraceae bacterium]MBR4565297.1 four helix bundle protein [Paludibacteraceae bacterium]
MTIQNFEELIIWQEARRLCTRIYADFKRIRDYGFNDQIQRASVSIMNNIAEGFDRSKITKDNKQFISFLNIASGSCGEVKSMLYLAQDLNYLSQEEAEKLRSDCISISAKITGLVLTLQDNNGKNNR